MFYPTLQGGGAKTKLIQKFYGYDATASCAENAFCQMRNMSARDYPLIATRPARGCLKRVPAGKVTVAMADHEGLICMEYTPETGAYLLKCGAQTFVCTDVMNGTFGAQTRTVVAMGAYLAVWPDKAYFNAAKLRAGDTQLVRGTDFGTMDVSFTQEAQTLTLELCDADGNVYGARVIAEEAPENPVNGAYWLDTSDRTNLGMLKRWSQSANAWTAIPTTYLRMTGGTFSELEERDGITLTLPKYLAYYDEEGAFWQSAWIDAGGENVSVRRIGNAIVWEGLVQHDGQIPPYRTQLERFVRVCEHNMITPEGYVPLTDEEIAAMTDLEIKAFFEAHNMNAFSNNLCSVAYERKTPDMDFVVECNNRLWGCFRGEQDGKQINEIYASALGSLKSWKRYTGDSTAAYAAQRGAEGAFTGAIVYGGNPLFFREQGVEMVYPSAAGAHQITYKELDGVQAGSGRSLQVVNGALYYKANRGVMRYDGTLPVCVSDALGMACYTSAAAARLHARYYISMQDTAQAWHLFVYDTVSGLWHEEDDTRFLLCAPLVGNVAFVTEQTGHIMAVLEDKTQEFAEPDFAWYCVTGNIGMNVSGNKYLSRMNLRLELKMGAEVQIFVEYDSDGVWHRKGCVTGQGLKTAVIPLRGRRCDHVRIKLMGIGQMKIYSMMQTIEEGSDY